MYWLTCARHSNLRWLTKEIAVNRNGRYHACRGIFFQGEKTETGCEMVKEGFPIAECPCDMALLHVAPESLNEFQKDKGLTDAEVTQLQATWTNPENVR